MGKESVVNTHEDMDAEERLERVEVELRSPTVVLSVRLDEETAKALHALARQRGLRISDLMREAATAFAASAPKDRSRSFVFEYAGKRLASGVTSVNSQGTRLQTTSEPQDSDSEWSRGVRTEAALAG